MKHHHVERFRQGQRPEGLVHLADGLTQLHLLAQPGVGVFLHICHAEHVDLLRVGAHLLERRVRHRFLHQAEKRDLVPLGQLLDEMVMPVRPRHQRVMEIGDDI